MLFEWIAIGGTIFWILTAAVGVAILAALEYENGYGATAATLAFAAVMVLFSDFHVIPWVMENYMTVVKYAGYYVAGGAGFAWVKWYLYLLNLKDRYTELRDKFCIAQGIAKTATFTEEQKSKWADWVYHEFRFSLSKFPPQVSEYKTTILMWMSYWPLSGLWTLLNDPTKRIFRFIYRNMAGGLQRISNHVFSDMAKDAPSPKKL